ncbi:MAG: hypothetical protein ACO1NX_07265 [Chitinophagaceae bacterium]
MPKGIAAGIGYAPSEAFYISTSVEKTVGRPLQAKGALQYRVLQKLQATLGVKTDTSTFYFGAGYQLSSIWLEAAANWHPHLGISPGIMITLIRKGHEKLADNRSVFPFVTNSNGAADRGAAAGRPGRNAGRRRGR